MFAGARTLDGVARFAATLLVALVLGLGAHLVATPLGHHGSLRDVAVLVAGLGGIALLFRRGELQPMRVLRNGRRCFGIAATAVGVTAALLAAEHAPNVLWDLTVSSAVLALTAFVAALAVVLFAERAVRAAVRAVVALMTLPPSGTSNVAAMVRVACTPQRTLNALERYGSFSRRGPP